MKTSTSTIAWIAALVLVSGAVGWLLHSPHDPNGTLAANFTPHRVNQPTEVTETTFNVPVTGPAKPQPPTFETNIIVTERAVGYFDSEGRQITEAEHQSNQRDMVHSIARVPDDERAYGIGVGLGRTNGLCQVLSVPEKSPASAGGLQPGDLILEVDKEPMTGLTFGQVINRLSGAYDSTVKLTITNGDTSRLVTLKRTALRY